MRHCISNRFGFGSKPVKMPFERLMELMAQELNTNRTLTLGDAALKYNESMERVADAIDALKVVNGVRSYIRIVDLEGGSDAQPEGTDRDSN